jgi:zinc D-Ala-D-Ala carboxypeptidase
MTKLTPNFTLEEFTHSQTAARRGMLNVPPLGSPERANLQRTAEVMEEVRKLLGDKPVLISSGYRSPQVNKAVGGSKGSAHMHALAADFSCPSFGTPLQICKALHPHMRKLGVDQLINEFPPDGWVHLGLTAGEPRHMALTIDTRGVSTGFA